MRTEEREFPVTVSQTLSKSCEISSSDFVVLSVSKDEDGYMDEDVSLDNINILEDFDKDHYTPSELIQQLSKLAKSLLEKNGKLPRFSKTDINKLNFLIEECEGWIVDEEIAVFD